MYVTIYLLSTFFLSSFFVLVTRNAWDVCQSFFLQGKKEYENERQGEIEWDIYRPNTPSVIRFNEWDANVSPIVRVLYAFFSPFSGEILPYLPPYTRTFT